jgi:hypothetical protein
MCLYKAVVNLELCLDCRKLGTVIRDLLPRVTLFKAGAR